VTVSPARARLRATLVDARVLVPTDAPGVYGRSAAFESVVEGLEGLVLRAGADRPVASVRFPPVLPRTVFEASGYLESFPDLIGSVHTFAGDEASHAALLAAVESGESWTDGLVPADVMLCSAVCHPLYPTCAGTLPAGGRRVEVSGWCFRHEPSEDPFRMQAFRQHDYVALDGPDEARRHRDDWIQRGASLLGRLGLEVEAVAANDPFFGRAGRLLAASQRTQELKLELVARIDDDDPPVALCSANSHLDHFALPFGIATADGEVAHTSCFGFGLDRITLALLARHGPDPDRWPAAVRSALWP
jgi:seryl-tRNA synthetase